MPGKKKMTEDELTIMREEAESNRKEFERQANVSKYWMIVSIEQWFYKWYTWEVVDRKIWADLLWFQHVTYLVFIKSLMETVQVLPDEIVNHA